MMDRYIMATDIFKKGSVEMLSLLLLWEKDSYGYQIAQLIKERSGGQLTVQEGSLYPILYRLEERKYIIGKEEVSKTPAGRSRIRIMYSITAKGRERFKELKEEYDTVHNGIKRIFSCSEVDVNE